MSKTVVGLLDDREDVEIVVTELVDSGFERNDISVMATDTRGEYVTETGSGETASGAVTGAGVGAAAGGIGGLLFGLAGLAIPGIGPIVAAGPIAAALGGAGIGALAGGALGALASMGVPKEEAEYYAEGVRRGGVLIAVKTEDDRTDIAANVLHNRGAVDIDERAAAWRKKGWSRFDETASAYSDEDITRERAAIPVAEADLRATDREVARATARAYNYNYRGETPAEETARPHEESSYVEPRRIDRPIVAGEDALQGREIDETAVEPMASSPRTPEPIGSETSSDKTISDKMRDTKAGVERAGRELGEELGLGSMSRRSKYTGVERRRNTGAGYTGVERRVA
jgi:hypothetical protein